MKTFKLETKGFESNNILYGYKITFPIGHYRGNNQEQVVEFQVSSYFPPKHDDYYEPLDKQVISERVKILYPDFFDGSINEPNLVQATTKRVLGRAPFHAIEI